MGRAQARRRAGGVGPSAPPAARGVGRTRERRWTSHRDRSRSQVYSGPPPTAQPQHASEGRPRSLGYDAPSWWVRPWRHARCRLLSGSQMRDLSLSRSQLLLLAGTANRPLAEEMAQHLGQPLCAVTMRRLADGEIFLKIHENVRGRGVFIIHPTNPPAENYHELLLLMDAARRASAARITAVLPYFGY